jgi:hypothetical protein
VALQRQARPVRWRFLEAKHLVGSARPATIPPRHAAHRPSSSRRRTSTQHALQVRVQPGCAATPPRAGTRTCGAGRADATRRACVDASDLQVVDAADFGDDRDDRAGRQAPVWAARGDRRRRQKQRGRGLVSVGGTLAFKIVGARSLGAQAEEHWPVFWPTPRTCGRPPAERQRRHPGRPQPGLEARHALRRAGRASRPRWIAAAAKLDVPVDGHHTSAEVAAAYGLREPGRLALMSLPAFMMPSLPPRAPTGRWRHGRGGVTRMARGKRFMDPSTRTST